MESHLTNDVSQSLHLMNIRGIRLEIKPLNDDHTKENIYSNIIVTKDSEIVDVNQEAFMNAYNELWLEKLRTQRNKRLAECDWVTLKAYSTQKDVPKAWRDYMQALRDLPANTEDLVNPVWPTPPE